MNSKKRPTGSTRVSVEPTSLSLGWLVPGERMEAILQASGGPGTIVVSSDRLVADPLSFGPENTEIRLTVVAAAVGELVWGRVLFRAEGSEVHLPVTAWWTEVPSLGHEEEPPLESEAVSERDSTLARLVPDPLDKEIHTTGSEVSGDGTKQRTYRGRVCPWCGANIRYDANSQLWVDCEDCRGWRKPRSIIRRLSMELYLGAREVTPALKEIWGVLSGRQKWHV